MQSTQEVAMLVLARQEGDGITFPDLNLEVEILRIQGSRVQIGVHAPREITVLRSELVSDELVGNGSSREDAKKALDLQNRLREVAKLLTTARLQWEQGDLEAVEKTLRSMVARQGSPDRATSQVSEPAASYNCSKPAVTHDCRSVCEQLKIVHPECPLRDIARAEGLAC
ncbi:MAG: carbon storage regulator [Planctomycetes bacterium]|nr:carbon storage regulator [Planctomycetota bacterium]